MGTLLSVGSRGPEVVELQKLLNSQVTPSPGLKPDGVFGNATRTAVINFQKANWLTPDGIVGPCTMNALKGTEAFVYLRPPAQRLSQPTDYTCWAASTAMLMGMTVPQVVAQARSRGVKLDSNDGQPNDSESDTFTNSTLLAKAFGLTMLPPMSWMPGALAQVVGTRGPLMMNLLWDANEYTRGAGSPGHMVVIAGMRGDGTAQGTTVLIYDPWKPNQGAVKSEIYGPMIRKVPASTYLIFHR